MLPDDFDRPAADDLTVEMACSFSRRVTFTGNEQQRRCMILAAWESGAFSGAQAHDALIAEGLLDHEILMGMYAGYVRALGRAEVL